MEIYHEVTVHVRPVAKITAVTHNGDGTRIENHFFLEELENGDVEMVVNKNQRPERLNRVFWTNTVKMKESENGEK